MIEAHTTRDEALKLLRDLEQKGEQTLARYDMKIDYQLAHSKKDMRKDFLRFVDSPDRQRDIKNAVAFSSKYDQWLHEPWIVRVFTKTPEDDREEQRDAAALKHTAYEYDEFDKFFFGSDGKLLDGISLIGKCERRKLFGFARWNFGHSPYRLPDIEIEIVDIIMSHLPDGRNLLSTYQSLQRNVATLQDIISMIKTYQYDRITLDADALRTIEETQSQVNQ